MRIIRISPDSLTVIFHRAIIELTCKHGLAEQQIHLCCGTSKFFVGRQIFLRFRSITKTQMNLCHPDQNFLIAGILPEKAFKLEQSIFLSATVV
ncbi:MAG: hypothetical protein ACD_39C01660G0002 [uncultured bacterium]|nr:MAG: hypothetical protein ACD_39C01660G0002 [uncultured bacterium]